LQRAVIIKHYFTNRSVLIAALPALVAGTGCYRYQPSTLDAVQPGQRISLTLAPSDAAALAPVLGPDAASLQGRLVRLAPADVTIALTQIARRSGPEQFLNDQPVTLPRESAVAIAVRRLDTPRTVLSIAGIVAAVVAGQIFMNQSGVFASHGTPSGNTK
jgi:hypothetical protein